MSLLSIILALYTAVAGGTAVRPPRPTAPVPATHVAAPRVATRAAAPGAATLALRSDLEHEIESPGWRGDEWSVTIVSLDRGDTLFARNPDLPLAPASNMKLFTTTSALYYLGPDYRYSTYMLADGDTKNGVLQGNLVVYGTGDPMLSFRFNHTTTATMRAFADSIAAQGIRQITGDVVGDGSYFTGPRSGPWDLSYIGASYAVPDDALSLNENLVTIQVSPGAKAGYRPVVSAIPGGTDIAVVNEATTTTGGGTSIDIRRDSYDGPLVVRGHIRRGAGTVTRVVPVADPAQYAAAALKEALQQKGITVGGRARSIHDPARSPVSGRAVFAPAFQKSAPPIHILSIYRSAPLIDMLDILMHLSHNMMAEQTLRTVGRVALGDGSIAGGHRAIMAMLERETGPDSVGLWQYDGSGLSPENRTTSRTLIRLLSFAARSPFYDSLWRTLPEAGHRHLMRMVGTPAQNNLRAKTGTIDHVSALSGYVRAADGERLAFSIISNNVPSTWKAKRIEDAIGARLASFTRPAESVASGAPASPPEVPGNAAAPATPVPAAPAGTAAAAPKASAPDAPKASAAPARPEKTRSYKIRKGDTLIGIAKRFDTSVKALEQANPGLSPRRLIPGKTIRIPQG